MVPARFWQEHNNHLRHQTETPSKLATPSLWSPSRGVSPSRAQNGIVSGLSSRFDGGSEPSVLSFAIDVSRGKVAENRIFDAHLLRLFHNRLLQWRFARADAALSAQTLNAEFFLLLFLISNIFVLKFNCTIKNLLACALLFEDCEYVILV